MKLTRWAATALLLVAIAAAQTPDERVQLKLDTSEAEAVLAMLEVRAAGSEPGEAEWQRLFASKPYVRLKRREAEMKREFTDEEFRAFVLSPELAARAGQLRKTLDAWKQADLNAAAEQVLAYLPANARIRADVYPMIKPKTNSFVFEPRTNPAIFLYLDPELSAEKFENTVAHELHHIGFASLAEEREQELAAYAPPVRAALEWMGAFGEGFAILAAAGGGAADPHAASDADERALWAKDLANFNEDLPKLEKFFLDVIHQRFASKDEERQAGFAFFGDAQGPWYTVGWRMAQMVEQRFGRAVLLECMAQPEELMRAYNQAAAEKNRRGEDWRLWSEELLGSLAPARN